MEKIERMLPVALSDADILEMSDNLGKKLLELEEAETERKTLANAAKMKCDALASEVSNLGKCVREKSEERPVDCEWTYHQPRPGMKQLVRLDTAEVIDERDMSDKDKQRAADLKQLRIPGIDPVFS